MMPERAAFPDLRQVMPHPPKSSDRPPSLSTTVTRLHLFTVAGAVRALWKTTHPVPVSSDRRCGADTCCVFRVPNMNLSKRKE
jgi:hypothetical protein